MMASERFEATLTLALLMVGRFAKDYAPKNLQNRMVRDLEPLVQEALLSGAEPEKFSQYIGNLLKLTRSFFDKWPSSPATREKMDRDLRRIIHEANSAGAWSIKAGLSPFGKGWDEYFS